MYRNSSSRALPIIIIIVIVAALIIGLVAVGRYLFSGRTNDSAQVSMQQQASDELIKTNAGRSVQMTVRGPIVADENFRTHRITVSPTNRNYTIYKGYLESTESTQNFNNNTRAYTEFVNALNKAALTKAGKYSPDEVKDLNGVCASGSLYVYDILNYDQVVKTYWTSTCKGSPGSFGASVNQVTNLFVTQIPNLRNSFTSTSLLSF